MLSSSCCTFPYQQWLNLHGAVYWYQNNLIGIRQKGITGRLPGRTCSPLAVYTLLRPLWGTFFFKFSRLEENANSRNIGFYCRQEIHILFHGAYRSCLPLYFLCRYLRNEIGSINIFNRSFSLCLSVYFSLFSIFVLFYFSEWVNWTYFTFTIFILPPRIFSCNPKCEEKI